MNRTLHLEVAPLLRGTVVRRGAIFGGMLVAALLAFEIFNYATTSFALSDVLGSLEFAGLRWSTVLALAFCGMDFAGIARLFTPQQKGDEPAEVWYLFGAWLLAAAMNAILTWWGVSIAIITHTSAGAALVSQTTMTKTVPVFVAMMVWLVRVLIIGTFSVAGENLFTLADKRSMAGASSQRRPSTATSSSRRPVAPSYVRPAPKPISAAPNRSVRSEPTYHPIGMSAQSYDDGSGTRR